MGRVKEKLLKGASDSNVVTLSPSEFAYVKDLNVALQMHLLRQRLVAGYLTITLMHHLPDLQIPEKKALEFELDLSDGSDHILTAKFVNQQED